MNKEEIKALILQQISEELDIWLDKQEKITDGLEYENQALALSQNISRILVTQSRGRLPSSRNKKNFKRVLGKLK
jgi:hypothetical protein